MAGDPELVSEFNTLLQEADGDLEPAGLHLFFFYQVLKALAVGFNTVNDVPVARRCALSLFVSRMHFAVDRYMQLRQQPIRA